MVSLGPSQNLLSDPGFEAGGTGWQSVNNGGRLIVTTEGLFRHCFTADGGFINNGLAKFIRMYRVTGGATYDASGWGKDEWIWWWRASIMMQWRDTSGNILKTDSIGTLTVTQNWGTSVR